MFRITRLELLVATIALSLASGCRENAEAERRESARANATAEAIAQKTSVTSISSATCDEVDEGKIVAAFQLEQGDYRARLRTALDALDKDVARARPPGRHDDAVKALRDHRLLLKVDLDAVDRSTELDWATLRAKVDRDLGEAPRRKRANESN